MLLIKGGRVYGTGAQTCDVLVRDGKIVSVSETIGETGDMTVLRADGYIVAPGLVDMHVHLREPGFEYKEDIMTGAAAAAAGGVTTCCCMPNTLPVADNAEVVRYIIDKAKSAPVRVLPLGAVTVGQRGGELTDFMRLRDAGAVALSDDGNPIQSAEIMRRALQMARECGMLIISHCEDAGMVRNFAVNEGDVSRKLGIPGRPSIAEEIMVARDAMLAAETGASIHIAHVSTAGSVEIIRMAKEAGISITAETCPQYFTKTEDETLRQGPLARVNPPLRTKQDVAAVIRGLADGTIDAIVTDHAPHSTEEKNRPLTDAPSGMIGLETSLALALTSLYHAGHLGIDKIIALMSGNPASILGLEAGTLKEGRDADIVLFDPGEEWIVEPELFKSKARNTPFSGMRLRGKVKFTISRGALVGL
ncbi:MAG: dihydroorotase [Oscillospiraceae bacterium]|jgi:dihydroorotase|nr:dihydroorotase [Oscillospiraceae bacterium]